MLLSQTPKFSWCAIKLSTGITLFVVPHTLFIIFEIYNAWGSQVPVRSTDSQQRYESCACSATFAKQYSESLYNVRLMSSRQRHSSPPHLNRPVSNLAVGTSFRSEDRKISFGSSLCREPSKSFSVWVEVADTTRLTRHQPRTGNW